MDLVKQATSEEIDLLFLDPVHSVHNTVPSKCWQIRGKEGTIILPSNSGRKRINIVGAFHPVTLKVSALLSEDNCDTFMIETFLKQLCDEYPDREKKLVIILDNAKYNHGAVEKAKSFNISLEFLPPYAPNLNLIERLWRLMKKELRRNKYLKTYPEFFDSTISFFQSLDSRKKELRSLLSLKFEIIKAY